MELRTAELESSQHLLAQVQVQSKELQFQLRDTASRLGSLQEELAEVRDGGASPTLQAGPSDLATLLLEAEGKYAARLGDARNRIRILEQERIQAEEEWSRASLEDAKALDRSRKLLDEREKDNLLIAERQREADEDLSKLTASLAKAEEINRTYGVRVAELESQLAQSKEAEIGLRQDLHDAIEKTEACALQIEALRSQESQLKGQNKVCDRPQSHQLKSRRGTRISRRSSGSFSPLSRL